MARLSARFPHVLVLRHEPDGAVADDRTYAARVSGRTPLQVGEAFVEHVRGTAIEAAERALLVEALEAARLVEAGA
jgi:exonuclease SbcD